ncbi:MAG: c-type cytochrome [Deltaproteobacteria bacterium]|nr:c-type cytochrome [Deltaproteobacteria bacterium]MBW2696808.1 c-type cytochrome [Deltaproteobacteria bacterium]
MKMNRIHAPRLHCARLARGLARAGVLILLAGSSGAGEVETLRAQATAIFGSLPENAATEARPMTPGLVELGRALYYDPRLSKNHDISCNSCHPLDRFGADGEATSPGHRGQRGGRNSPTSLNAALHIAQFWDGREPDVEAQAKGPVLNPIEMAMPSEAAVVAVLVSIPGYAPLFAAAFPDEPKPITYDNMASAIGAFERGLLAPSPFDAFVSGDDEAISAKAVKGANLFIASGCVTCHSGPAFGGGMFRKIGQVHAYPTSDIGREAVTGRPEDRYVFKVPSLRNTAQTGPWFHDGGVTSLDEAVRLMAYHQLGLELSQTDRTSLIAFLETLTAAPNGAYVAKPELPESGPDTPAPDPS